MLRSRPPSFHKSMPNIANHHHRASSASRVPSTNSTSSSKLIIGRDELEERYLDLRDRHLGLRKEATVAQEELRLLHVKLNRLLDEKKRYFRHRRTDREVALEETIYDLEQRLGKQAMANDRLRDRMQLMRLNGGESETEVRGQRSSQALVVKRPYSHVQSRVDSGLTGQSHPPPPVFSFRPSSSKSSLELQHRRSPSPSKSGILKNSSTETSKLPLSATMLMREAKEEIIRLEEIIAEQQMMLDTLLSADPGEEEEILPSTAKLPTSNSFSYQLTTTTTATASLTAASGATSSSQMSNGYHHANHHQNLADFTELQNGSSSSPAVIDLYTKYQQLVMRQETAQKLSTDVRTLIESLYRSLCEEKAKVAELRTKLAAKDELNLVIAEKDTQIETLRRENALLQQSLADCIAQCMTAPESEGQSSKGDEMRSMVASSNPSASSKYFETLKAALTARSEAAQQEADQLGKRLAETEAQLASERSRFGALQVQYSTLQQLSESDALHVNHLKAKIARLTALVFPTTAEMEVESPKNQNERARSAAVTVKQAEKEKEVQQQRESSEEEEDLEKNVDQNSNDLLNYEEDEEKNLQSFMNGSVTEELDQLLNSLPPAPTSFERRRSSKD